jgi:molybdopterin guanine dinucleotide-containing S/N-oxide reductase-like protein
MKEEKTGGKKQSGEETHLKALGLLGGPPPGSNTSAIDVKDGKIVRIRPLHFNWKYKPEEYNAWKLEARGRVFEAGTKTLPAPFCMSYKKRVYSPNRVKYPLKRVDWNPEGERHPENRGISKYKRISWDEATDIIASEIKRVQAEYGPYAILCQGDGHGETKNVHASHGCHTNLLVLMGGFTLQTRNPDSWEGWYWGAKHMWGMEPCGLQVPLSNVIKDMSENTDMILFWGFDPETTPWGFHAQMSSRMSYWFTELGIESIYICPDLNYGAAVHADKWVPVKPNTDAALHLAIAYVWITEGTYDKDYVATHTVGFDKYEDYVLGKEDGIPKTPEWASPLCGVPVWTIKALARKWASRNRNTTVAHYCGGSYIRGPYSTEPARQEICLLAMQGIGKPGRHQLNMCGGWPRGEIWPDLQPAYNGIHFGLGYGSSVPKQFIPRDLIHEAILNPPISWYGTTLASMPTEDQFVKYKYPIPKEEGGTEIHMIWTDAPCWTTCWNEGNRMMEAFRSRKIEFVLAQHPWLENDCLFADIILPSNTKFEEDDIQADNCSGQFNIIYPEGKCIEPIGESKSDYEVVCEIAKKLGMYEEYTQGRTVEEWIKFGFDNSGVDTMISWEDLKEKKYFIVPTASDWKDDPVSLMGFYEDCDNNPLQTPTGKIEIYSQGLDESFPGDKERPPVPHWVPDGATHQESLQSARAKDYPLLIVSNHPRWRVHAQGEDISWFREIPTCKVKGPDGYLYQPLWIHPIDASQRGIKNGDIVKIYNERGAVLGGAFVTERIIPGAVSQDHGASVDEIIPQELDRAGNNNAIAPAGLTSKNATGMATSGYLVEVEKVTMAQMEEWKRQYPEAFERGYDPASGLRFDGWVIKV